MTYSETIIKITEAEKIDKYIIQECMNAIGDSPVVELLEIISQETELDDLHDMLDVLEASLDVRRILRESAAEIYSHKAEFEESDTDVRVFFLATFNLCEKLLKFLKDFLLSCDNWLWEKKAYYLRQSQEIRQASLQTMFMSNSDTHAFAQRLKAANDDVAKDVDILNKFETHLDKLAVTGARAFSNLIGMIEADIDCFTLQEIEFTKQKAEDFDEYSLMKSADIFQEASSKAKELLERKRVMEYWKTRPDVYEKLKKDKDTIETNISKLEKDLSGSSFEINFLMARKEEERKAICEPTKNLATQLEKTESELSHIGLFKIKRKKELQAKREKMKIEMENLCRDEQEKLEQHEQHYQTLLRPLLDNQATINNSIKQEKAKLLTLIEKMEKPER